MSTFFLTVALFVIAGCPIPECEAVCPKQQGASDCRYTACTPQECALKGLECCPKPCGGSWCIKGVGAPSEYPEICPTALSGNQSCPEPRSNTTCEELNCTKLGFICCRNGCQENYCYQVPGSSV
ncbi:hypothetical protein V5799_026519 [Amblyomma americanum]|uniref:Uncharacterized protein n=1 Tax=Amblyomma americanum TaxID=6943 RepID=A0AAQ4DIC6_AMBAM